jgi:hypothetical protein
MYTYTMFHQAFISRKTLMLKVESDCCEFKKVIENRLGIAVQLNWTTNRPSPAFFGTFWVQNTDNIKGISIVIGKKKKRIALQLGQNKNRHCCFCILLKRMQLEILHVAYEVNRIQNDHGVNLTYWQHCFLSKWK